MGVEWLNCVWTTGVNGRREAVRKSICGVSMLCLTLHVPPFHIYSQNILTERKTEDQSGHATALSHMSEAKWSESHSVVSSSLWLHEPYSSWNFPSQNTGAGSLSLLQEIFPTQGLKLDLLHCRCILYLLSHKGSPWEVSQIIKNQGHLPPSPILFLLHHITLKNTIYHVKLSIYLALNTWWLCAE